MHLYSVHVNTILHYIHLKILEIHGVNYCVPVTQKRKTNTQACLFMAKWLWIMIRLFLIDVFLN